MYRNIYRKKGKNGRMNKMTEDNCKIGDPKVITNTKGAPRSQYDIIGILLRQAQ